MHNQTLAPNLTRSDYSTRPHQKTFLWRRISVAGQVSVVSSNQLTTLRRRINEQRALYCSARLPNSNFRLPKMPANWWNTITPVALQDDLIRAVFLASKINAVKQQTNESNNTTNSQLMEALASTGNEAHRIFDVLLPSVPSKWSELQPKIMLKKSLKQAQPELGLQLDRNNHNIVYGSLFAQFWKQPLSNGEKTLNQSILKHCEVNAKRDIVWPLLLSAAQLLRSQIYIQAEGMLQYIVDLKDKQQTQLYSCQANIHAHLLLSQLYQEVRRNDEANTIGKEYGDKYCGDRLMLQVITLRAID